MSFSKTADLFFHFIKDALREVENNFGIYSLYVLILTLSTAISNLLNFYFRIDDPTLPIISKLVFSIVPLLIVSKIIYVFKIRNIGIGDFTKTFFAYFLFSILYFIIFLVCALFFSLPAYMSALMNSMPMLVLSALGLIPVCYLIIFYSLTPVVAALECDSEKEINYFRQSKFLTKRNIWLVAMNQFFAVMIFLITTSVFLIKDPGVKIAVSVTVALLDAIFTVVLTMTSVKIYFYLNDLE